MSKPAPASVARSYARKDMMRDELLGKAAELFARRGFANTTISDIARELGLSRSSLYHYFPSKDDVLRSLIQETTVAAYDMLARLRDEPSLTATERLKRAILSSVERRLAGGSRMRVLERLEGDMPPEMLEQFNRVRRQILQFYVDLVEEGIRSGEFRLVDTKIIAFAVLGMCNWTAWWYSPAGSRSAEQVATAMADFALAALARRGSAKLAAGSLGGAIRQLKEDIAVLERLAR